MTGPIHISRDQNPQPSLTDSPATNTVAWPPGFPSSASHFSGCPSNVTSSSASGMAPSPGFPYGWLQVVAEQLNAFNPLTSYTTVVPMPGTRAAPQSFIPGGAVMSPTGAVFLCHHPTSSLAGALPPSSYAKPIIPPLTGQLEQRYRLGTFAPSWAHRIPVASQTLAYWRTQM